MMPFVYNYKLILHRIYGDIFGELVSVSTRISTNRCHTVSLVTGSLV